VKVLAAWGGGVTAAQGRRIEHFVSANRDATVPGAAPIAALELVTPYLKTLAQCIDRDAVRGARPPSLIPGADAMFDSGAVPHATRWGLPYPGRDAIFSYMQESFEATLEALAKSRDQERYFFRLSLLHEDMHGEAMLMTLHTLGLPAPKRKHIVAPAAAVEPSRYLVEVLHQIARSIGAADIRITEFQMSPKEFAFSGEAANVAEAIEYVGRLRKEQELGRFKIDSPNPNILPNERAQFRVSGRVDLPGAKR
jgi:hypothetical protein